MPAFRLMPLAADIVNVRQRQYLVTDLVPADCLQRSARR